MLTPQDLGFEELFRLDDSHEVKRVALEHQCVKVLREGVREFFKAEGLPLALVDSPAMTAKLRASVRGHVDRQLQLIAAGEVAEMLAERMFH